MLRRSRAFLIGMAAVLTMLLVPATFTTEAAPTPCADVFFVISYIDPVSGDPVEVFDDSNAKFGIPVGVELTFSVYPDYTKASLKGKQVKFSSPNQFLTYIPGSASDTDGGNFTYKQNLPNDRPNVNWQLIWNKGDVDATGTPLGDSVLTFKAVIDPANVIDPVTGDPMDKGALMTIGVQIAGARCSAKIEIYGLPGGGGGPGPQPCPGIVVDIYYEASDGKFYPAIPNVQSPTNTQVSGPSVGNNVLYVITPLGQSNQPVVFDKILHHVDKFFRQNVVLPQAQGTKSDPAGVPNTIQNGTVSFVFWNKNSNTWNGQTLIIKTVAKSAGLDTATFVSKLSPNGAIVSLCSVHKEIRIAQNPVAPQGTEYPDPFAP